MNDPKKMINVSNYILMGFAAFIAIDLAARLIYRPEFTVREFSEYERPGALSIPREKFRAIFVKEEKAPSKADSLHFAAGIKLSGVFVHPDEPERSSAAFVLAGKESILARAGGEITSGVILVQIGAMDVVIRKGAEEFRLGVESVGAEEVGGGLIITSQPSAHPDPSAMSDAKRPPGLITADPDHKIVKPISQ